MLRGIVKWTVIGALGTALLVGVVGMGRVKTALLTVQDHFRSNVDDLIDTRVALRHEVEKLKNEYPVRIAEIRIQLREIDRDLALCTSDVRKFEDMLALAESDSQVLRTRLETADSDADGVNPTFVEFRAQRLDLGAAYTRAAEIAEKALTYQEHLSDLQTQQGLLIIEEVFHNLAITLSQFPRFILQVTFHVENG